jgi:hypothetical protein
LKLPHHPGPWLDRERLQCLRVEPGCVREATVAMAALPVGVTFLGVNTLGMIQLLSQCLTVAKL